MSDLDAALKSRLENIRSQVASALAKSGRLKSEVRLIAVTKGQPIEKIMAATRLGLSEFAENYVQEWRAKRESLASQATSHALEWHFIGHLQTNKVRQVVGDAEWIHSVDSERLATAISRAASAKGIDQKILIEVNLAAESSKSGILETGLDHLINHCVGLGNLKLEGLMTMPPMGGARSGFYFSKLREMLSARKHLVSPKVGSWSELSMGTSDDFAEAIREGATMVRLGRVLFGERNGGGAQ